MTDETRLSELESKQQFDSTRQRDIFSPLDHQSAHCTLVGCGGIGSWAAQALTKLGIVSVTLVDFDTVEPHNIPNQWYRMEDNGRLKVEALKELCEMFGASKVETIEGAIEDHPEALRGLVICGLDSMEARQNVWDLCKFNMSVEKLVDGRLGREDIVVYTVNPCDSDDIEYYESTLKTDEEVPDLGCTERAIIDVAFKCASLISNVTRNHFTGERIPKTIVANQGNLKVTTYG